jgi:hypothetical protein
MNRFELKLKAIEETMREHVTAYQAIYKKADDEQRDPTEQERLTVEEHHRALGTLKEERDLNKEQLKTLQGVEDLGRTLGPAVPSTSMSVQSEPQDRIFQGYQQHKSLGEMFTDSAQYKATINVYREAGGRFPQGFSSGAVALESKGTLLEGAGGGGGPLAAPSRRSSPASSRSCSSGSRSPICSCRGSRRSTASGTSWKAPRPPAPRVSLRADSSPSRRSA